MINKDSSTLGRILIVDDEQVNAETIMDTLLDVNYQVTLATHSEEAKVLVKNHSFDLVLLDVWMPGQDGMALLEEWLGAGFTTPIIMMSGHAEHNDVVRAIKLGAVDFLKKPLHDILSVVRRVLGRHESQRARLQSEQVDFSNTLRDARRAFERKYLLFHLNAYNYNISKVAEQADMERTTLYRKFKDLGIEKP